jgi:hypothetical protein
MTGWPLIEQFVACGLDVPVVTRGGWAFVRAQLFVHPCEKKACPDCRAAAAKGWRTQRVTADEVADGRALDVVAGLLWRPPPVQATLL